MEKVTNMKIGIIGFGNLGKSLSAGLVNNGIRQEDICITAKSNKTITAAKQLYDKAHVVSNKNELVQFSDVIVLLVEPQNAYEVLDELNGSDIDGKIILSFMSGIKISDIQNSLSECPGRYCVVRAMPNIAISTGKGIIGISYNDVDESLLDSLFHTLRKLGLVLTIAEDKLETITVTAACGMAAACVLIESYQNSAADYLPHELAANITQNVFQGVLSLLENNTTEELLTAIATKGGSTEAGLNAIHKPNIQSELNDFFHASFSRINNIRKNQE